MIFDTFFFWHAAPAPVILAILYLVKRTLKKPVEDHQRTIMSAQRTRCGFILDTVVVSGMTRAASIDRRRGKKANSWMNSKAHGRMEGGAERLVMGETICKFGVDVWLITG